MISGVPLVRAGMGVSWSKVSGGVSGVENGEDLISNWVLWMQIFWTSCFEPTA
jgi:hypothetical protein